MYAPTTQGSAAGVRTANGVLAYPSFQSGTYDAAFHAAAVSYQNSASMIPHAYMVPAAIQQMYPPNTMLSYQAAMNMLSPQHGQPSPNIYGYRPDAASSQQQQQQQAPQQQQDADSQSAQHRSHEGSPATPNGVGTPNSNPIKPETTTESDDEGSKLNILSQLCSEVLDRTPDTSNATTTSAAVSQASTTTATTTSPTTTSAPIKTEQVEEQKSNDQSLAANVKLETKDSAASSPSKETTTQETASNEEGDVVKKEE